MRSPAPDCCGSPWQSADAAAVIPGPPRNRIPSRPRTSNEPARGTRRGPAQGERLNNRPRPRRLRRNKPRPDGLPRPAPPTTGDRQVTGERVRRRRPHVWPVAPGLHLGRVSPFPGIQWRRQSTAGRTVAAELQRYSTCFTSICILPSTLTSGRNAESGATASSSEKLESANLMWAASIPPRPSVASIGIH